MNITDLEFCRSTAPSPFLDASVCRVVEQLGLKYGSVTSRDACYTLGVLKPCYTVENSTKSDTKSALTCSIGAKLITWWLEITSLNT